MEQTAVIEQMMAKVVEKVLGTTKEHDKGKEGPGAVTKEQVTGEQSVLAMFSHVSRRSDCHRDWCLGNWGPQQGVWKTRCWAGLPTHVLGQAGDTGSQGGQWNAMAIGDLLKPNVSGQGYGFFFSGCRLILGGNILSRGCGLEAMCLVWG